MAEKKEGKEVVVLNRGKRNYQISGKRTLKPNATATVTGKEAKLLLGQRDLVDASKVMPPSKGDKDLKKENDKLKKENEQLKAKQAADDLPKLKAGDEVELKDGSRALVVKVHKNGGVVVKGAKGGEKTVPLPDLKKVA